MTPYYDDGRLRIYHARWEDVWASLGLKHEDVALLWADPPYGIRAAETQRRGDAQKARSGKTGADGVYRPKPKDLARHRRR